MTSKPKPTIDLNAVDEKVLIQKLKISPRLAKRILAFRPYQSVDQLQKVWGIDAETLARITPLVRVGEAETGTEIEMAGLTGSVVQPTGSIPPTPRPPVPVQVDVIKTEPEKELKISEPLDGKQATSPKNDAKPTEKKERKPSNISWKVNVTLLFILIIAAIFRFSGINWDDNHHQHPDERFITSVTEQIRGVSSIGDYFDTANSALNPLKFGSYTYGMLPLFLTRMVSEWLRMANYDAITLVGRVLSGLFDLAALFLLYLLGEKLYNRRTGLLAMVLGAAAVLPIQLSHYYTVDSFSTVFVVACFYFALLAIPLKSNDEKLDWSNLTHFAIFGFMVGLAGACKVNTLPIFGIIILAGLARLITGWKHPNRNTLIKIILTGWIIGLVTAFLAFRIFQPYAFSGPGFFNFGLNQRWVDIIKEVTNQVAGNSEWPPNHHWTNRPVSYAWTNMIEWGMGLPLGIAGWLGFLWAGWRMWKGEWRSHFLPFFWTAAYFIWQNAQFWRYMRYFLPIYPFLFLFAAWALLELYDTSREGRERFLANGFNLGLQLPDWRKTWKGALTLAGLVIVLGGTYLYAFAFLQIYIHPITRINASRWILQNIPGPLNVLVDSQPGVQSYPVAIANQQIVTSGDNQSATIHLTKSGSVSSINSTDIRPVGAAIYFKISKDEKGEKIVTETRLAVADDDQANKQLLTFGDVTLDMDQTYYLFYKIDNSSQLTLSDVILRNDNKDDPLFNVDVSLQDQAPGETKGSLPIKLDNSLRVNRIEINTFHQVFVPGATTLKLSLFKDGDDQNVLASASQKMDFPKAGMHESPTFTFNAVPLTIGTTYRVKYEITQGGPLKLSGAPYTMETSWDDALPLGVDGYDALGAIYNPYNLELYEPDTPEKRDSMIDILSKSDYIVISSNRAYDSMPRLPLRYPMTLKYYQELFNCNCSGDNLENAAYNLKSPFKSPLGFDLVATFENSPAIGPFVWNDQSADESFTVYDHPKVFIFKKSGDFSVDHLKNLLNSVDLTQVIFQTPMSYTQAPNALQFTADQLSIQRLGGTWSSMFDPTALLNSNEVIGGIAWYLALLLLGWMVLPLIFVVFGGLPDRGYPLIRMAGLIILTWLVWFLGSINWLAFTQLNIEICGGLVLLLNLLLAWRRREALAATLRSQWKQILSTEVIFLAVFLFSLSIRLGNPDLWHPWLGGEKPMDFSYFNSVLKAVYFPPENPWFSGHYLNYYYYGYVIAAIPTKLLGIIPTIAYNLILPSWFAMTGIGLFSFGYNLIAGLGRYPDSIEASKEPSNSVKKDWWGKRRLPYYAGIGCLLAVLVLGNLYEVREFWQYLPETVHFNTENASIGDQAGAVLAGAIQVITGQSKLPGDNGRWYFEASRPILHNGPDTPIAEFPYFTFLYADPHAHLLTMPFYALALSWLLTLIILPFSKMGWRDRILSLVTAGLIFGSFRASHTWDYPTFIGLGLLVICWSVWRSRHGTMRQTIQTQVFYGIAFLILTTAFYWPFVEWFKTEYVAVDFWTGARTPLLDYLFVFGLSLFVMISLMIHDLIAEFKAFYHYWIRTSGQGFFESPHFKWYLGLFLVLAGMILLWFFNYQVLAFGLPLLAGTVYLAFFKHNLSSLRRIIWLMFGIGLLLTLMVEVFVIRGDSGRQNMVFRFYNEAWFVLGIALCAALVEMLPEMSHWPRRVRWVWLPVLGLLVLGAASYPLVATQKKMTDRWPDIQNPPHTLDGAAFMLGEANDPSGQTPAIYNDDNRKLDLSKDYAAIRFMQDNVSGSPVIVEGHTTEYRWGSRFSIYTGLPSVVGWSWHVRQHNSLLDGAIVDKRIDDVNNFYNTTDIGATKTFLARYSVKYIVVGDLERAYYDASGINKFEDMVKQGLVKIVYGDNTKETTTVFEVLKGN